MPALLIGLGSSLLPPRLDLAEAGDGGASQSAPAADPEPDGGAGASPEASAGGGGADPDGTGAVGGTGGGIDREQTVNVLNGAGTPGLATIGANRLAVEGWTGTLPGNWVGAPVENSVVFFNGEDQRAAAEAVAADLGITDLIDGADVASEISVVLGPEFE
ncbi:LytR C-terminal domain-containing protein [Arthrobacter sp. RIT-PI-e]|uniref:LytR C-terminal domain-containing protein n=1 Tax=Arthrobacter sp. RIT-PI-e TaxID=1681197 RepID=UPI000675D1A0|nr:LytR C-terminal domain-containing protein [Arthrobacter sp. RIT-PI-e]